LPDINTVNLDEPFNIGCKVSDVYPKPLVSFILPNGKTAPAELVNETELSNTDTSFYMHNLLNEISYTPTYADHNNNLTCSVFSQGSTNITTEKSERLNILGLNILSFFENLHISNAHF
jgi:hypothetical protein